MAISTYNFQLFKEMSENPDGEPPVVQSSQSSSQHDKIWALKGGSMRVVSSAKKKPSDNYMVLQLEFKFANETRPRRIGK